MNIKLIPNQWTKKNIPLTVIQHRLLTTDPLYKFVINAVINARSNIAVRRDSENNNYYDILNMSIVQDAVISPRQWVDYINNFLNLNLLLGENYQSEFFNELAFVLESDRDIFDSIYDTIKDNELFNAEGVNVLVDFNIKLSGGFIRNKLGLDTNNIKNWILDGLNFSILKLIMKKDELSENFTVRNFYKNLYELGYEDVELLNSLFNKNNNLMPLNDGDENIFWAYLNSYIGLNSLETKQSLFGFQFDGFLLTEVNTKTASFGLNQYNRPINIQTQDKFDYENQKIYVTFGGPGNPVSSEIYDGVITDKSSYLRPKVIQTKINNHIYMVNKK